MNIRHFYKRDNFVDFLFVFSHTKCSYENELSLNGKNLLLEGDQFLEGGKPISTEFPPLKVYPLPLNVRDIKFHDYIFYINRLPSLQGCIGELKFVIFKWSVVNLLHVFWISSFFVCFFCDPRLRSCFYSIMLCALFLCLFRLSSFMITSLWEEGLDG